MSITTAKAAFEKGLKGSAGVITATMNYEQGGKVQVFTFELEDGAVIVNVPASADIVTTVMAAGVEHAASIKKDSQ